MSKKQFVISSHVVIQLGEQLVSDEVTAIIELVKNAYDADARRVTITVDTRAIYTGNILAWVAAGNEPRAGYISIRDTGTGMDDSDITNGWLHISFSAKRGANKAGIVTPRYKRAVLGSKGVGRLSTQRLGNSLDLFSLKEYCTPPTKKEPERWRLADEGVHIGINWNNFQEDVPLQEVPVYSQVWRPQDGKAGTELVITDLKNPIAWEEANSRRALVSTLAQLVSPFAPVKAFNLVLSVNSTPIDLYEISKQVRNTALATFKFEFTGTELHIDGKVKTSLFRGGNAAEDAEHYQLLARDNGADFFEYLKQNNVVPNMQAGDNNWFFTFKIVLQAESLGLVKQPIQQSEILITREIDGLDNLGTIDTQATAVTSEQPFPKLALVSPGPFHGEIDQLAYENSEVDAKGEVFTDTSDYKAYLRRQSGVRIYRDGFGIRPYGIDGDDWMGFQSGTTSGKSFYGLRPKNLIGYIALTAKENGILEEKTDREGFVLNDASRNFFTLVYKVRDEINNVLNRVRRRFNDYKREENIKAADVSSPTEVIKLLRDTTQHVSLLREQARHTRVEAVRESLTRKIKDVQSSPLLSGNDAELEKLLVEARDELVRSQEVNSSLFELQRQLDRLAPTASYLESQIERLTDQLSDFTQLAGLGMTAEALAHEISNVVDRLFDEAKQVSSILRKQKNADNQLIQFVEHVRSSMHALRRQTQHLDDSLQYVREKREIVRLLPFVNELKSFYELRVRFQENSIKIQIDNISSEGFAIFCNRGNLAQVFDNLIINSEYWLKEATKQDRTYVPQILIEIQQPFIRISDNGLGVDPGIVAQLFLPFTTTKPRGTGRGLGLFISKQLMESMGATISLLPTLNRFKRPYIFQLDFTNSTYEQTVIGSN
jgi:signal transduction histidine kinase